MVGDDRQKGSGPVHSGVYGYKLRGSRRPEVPVKGGASLQVRRYPREKNRAATKNALIALGIVAAFTPIVAPIHEFGHLWASLDQGCSARIVSWVRTEACGTGVIRLAGYWFELLVFSAITLWKRWPITLGYATGTFLYAFFSSDLSPAGLGTVWAIMASPVLVFLWWRFGKTKG
jgi:hypothetical protein